MTTFLSWEKCYTVHHDGMDQQHAKIFSQINLLWESTFKEKKREIREMLIQGLILSIQQHFRDEEALLDAHHYHDLANHRFVHFGLSRQLHEFDNRLNQLHYHNAPEMMEFLLKQVVVKHILRDDRDYVPLFKKTHQRNENLLAATGRAGKTAPGGGMSARHFA